MSKLDTANNMLKDVTVQYMMVHKKSRFVGETGTEHDGIIGRWEYKLNAFIDEDTADEIEEQFKNKVNSIKTSNFEERTGMTAPHPDQKKQFFVKLSTNAHDKDDNEIEMNDFRRPRVFKVVGKSNSGANLLKDITLGEVIDGQNVLPANGSVVDVQYNLFKGSMKLANVVVHKLVPFVKTGSGEKSVGVSALGEVVAGDVEELPTEKPKTAKPKVLKEDTPEYDEDIPF